MTTTCPTSDKIKILLGFKHMVIKSRKENIRQYLIWPYWKFKRQNVHNDFSMGQIRNKKECFKIDGRNYWRTNYTTTNQLTEYECENAFTRTNKIFKSTNTQMNACYRTNERTNERTHIWKNRWMNKWKKEGRNKWMNERTNKSKEQIEWTNEWTIERKHRPVNQGRAKVG
jgi:hypothetical protein